MIRLRVVLATVALLGCGGAGVGTTGGQGGDGTASGGSGESGGSSGNGGSGSGGTTGSGGGTGTGGASATGGATGTRRRNRHGRNGAGSGGATGSGGSATGGAGGASGGATGQVDRPAPTVERAAAGERPARWIDRRRGSRARRRGRRRRDAALAVRAAVDRPVPAVRRAHRPAGALIHNDVFWKDTSGTPIYSQGGGVFNFNGTYYWYGVKYNGAVSYAANTKKNSDTSFAAITCYSSTDLVTWKHENDVLTTASLGANVDSATWIGRMGVVYNANTKKYVLISQYQGGPAGTGELFATSDTPTGTFAFDHIQAAVTNVANTTTGDQTIFTDDDGKSYLICSSSQRAQQPLRRADPRLRLAEHRRGHAHLRRRRARGEHDVQVQRHLLLLLVGSARLERLAQLLHRGHQHHGPLRRRGGHREHRQRLQPRHADRILRHRQGDGRHDGHLRRRSLERLRRQRARLQRVVPADVQRDDADAWPR